MASVATIQSLPTPPLGEGEHPVDYSELKRNLENVSLRDSVRFERKMGDTELSYFLPSRESGVNDMYLHLGFRATESVVARSRVRLVWSILRLRHPLMSAHVEMHDYNDVRFVYPVPASVDELLKGADANLEYRAQSKDDLIDSYLNGPRTLSSHRLSYLVVSQASPYPGTSIPTPPHTPSPTEETGGSVALATKDTTEPTHQYELLICAMHFLGDGMALHTFANDFLGLLGSDKTELELELQLSDEWKGRWGDNVNDASVLPRALEDNIPLPWTKLRRAAANVDFQLSQQRLIGGHAFPRRKHVERRTIVPTVSYPEDRTKAILKKCKANGVSISAALFAICNAAWARIGGGSKEMPILMYSALNLRPYFTVKQPSPWDSYWFLAIGYFNVILPNFLPEEKVEATFWHRARLAKEQSTRAAKSPLIVSRTHEMARERGERSRGWAKEDDERANGTWVPPAKKVESGETTKEPVLPPRAKVSSTALMGLSLLGNLDGIYKHAKFPAVKLHTLTTGSRQRHGAMLLFGYTFAGKLWISLGYDENGFADGVVDRFWTESIACVDEFLG